MSKNRLGQFTIPPAIIGVAILCLWANEGRFNFYLAARQTTPIASPSLADAAETVSYTAKLRDVTLPGKYVEEFSGYYQVFGQAEIYCWKRTEDDDGVSWSKGWYSHCEANQRNRGLRQTLRSVRLTAPVYRVGDLDIDSLRLHFSDGQVPIGLNELDLNPTGSSAGLVAAQDYYYLRKPESQNELGDERISYQGIPTVHTATYFGQIVSEKGVGKQFGNRSGFIANIIQDDGVLHHLVNGSRSEALSTVKSHYRKLLWLVRLIGTAAIVLGLMMLLQRFLYILTAIPLIGDVVELGAFLFSLVLGVSIGVVTIVSSMVYHNPWTAFLGLMCLAGLVSFLVLLRKKVRNNVRQRLMNDVAPVSKASAPDLTQEQLAEDQGHAERAYCNLVRLAMTDGELDPAENQFLVDWARARNLSDESIVELFDQAKRETENGLEITRFEDLYNLIALAMIDGYLSKNELHEIFNFGLALGMNRAQVNAVISQVRRGEYQEPAAA